MHRRDLLKLFGVGGLVAPVIGGSPDLRAQARIIEPPKVELVSADIPTEVTEPAPPWAAPLEVTFRIKANGQTFHLTADTFLTEYNVHTLPWQDQIGYLREELVDYKFAYELKGQIVPNREGDLLKLLYAGR
jgi:hypothetical protein